MSPGMLLPEQGASLHVGARYDSVAARTAATSSAAKRHRARLHARAAAAAAGPRHPIGKLLRGFIYWFNAATRIVPYRG
jgi:hypothetical protein